jgi:hypothetical protein
MSKSGRQKNALSSSEREALLRSLKVRFEKHLGRHRGVEWSAVQKRLELRPEKLWSIAEMEKTGGEPDVIAYDEKSGEYVFCDCAAESPNGRRSLCYDREALDSRKASKPKTSADELAAAIGIEILDEAGYRHLQELGSFDTKTSS